MQQKNEHSVKSYCDFSSLLIKIKKEVLINDKSRMNTRHFDVFAVLLLCDLKGSKNEGKIQPGFHDRPIWG